MFTNTHFLALIAFFMDTAFGMVAICIPLLATVRLQVSVAILGIIGAGGPLVYVLTTLGMGKLSDRWGQKPMVVAGSLLFLLLSSTVPLLQNWKQLLIVSSSLSFAVGLFWPSIQALLGKHSKKGALLKNIGTFNIAWSCGITLGIISGGLLFAFRYSLPFHAASIISLLILILVWKKKNISSEATLYEKDTVSPTTVNIRSRYMYAAWIANFASWFSVGTLTNLFPKLGLSLNFPITIISFIVFLPRLAQTIMFALLRYNKNWHYQLKPLLACQFFGLAGLILILSGEAVLSFSIGFTFIGLSIGATYYSSIFYGLDCSTNKATKSGIHESILGSGLLLGPLTGGFLAEHFNNLRLPYLVCILVMLGAILLESTIIACFPLRRKHCQSITARDQQTK